jgi:hypothetical protein
MMKDLSVTTVAQFPFAGDLLKAEQGTASDTGTTATLRLSMTNRQTVQRLTVPGAARAVAVQQCAASRQFRILLNSA